ncbi:phosphatidate cytidylyltransferase [Campylobacter mucosalis]|uniref:Phosphatidate cytidylyltransferase n=1 Tax=Campylobacter mucosalis CCUG 21559 TaxID=1032067 RepID=A0A6G5QE99_9BACT|nr:phosphatidate cytidylyltransferase [Campylobacter mucosalis]KEA45856.1 phosphatidate cytidylyltransferase [Campylobacter mucosalis]QCD44033.1 CDP-diglyceride synthetase [Campylobacter mucosalis CCUG 21559]QKF62390.1 CDP-diglyceride synthetase [Campylobacter mucosalis]
MKQRIITGVAMLVALLAVFYINSYLLNFFILGVVLTFAFLESLKLYQIEQKSLVFIALAFYTLTLFTNPIFIALVAILIVASVIAHIKSENLKAVVPFVYPTTPIFLIWMLYSEYGIGYLAWLFLIVIASDSGAYFVGKFFGKRPFSPSSPNKTLEGVFGGVAAGTIVGTIFGNFIIEGFTQIICASFLVALFGVWGDLFESYLKRLVDVKDSGNLFPGHGGMLDRIDGYLFGVIALLWTLSW